MRKLIFVLISCFFGLTACTTNEELDFAPASDPAATYQFAIVSATGTTFHQFTLADITQFASKTGTGDTWENCTFMLKGKDKATGAEVFITGRANTNDSYLNIAINQNGNTYFYKDCNNFWCRIDTGTDKRGSFIRLSNFSSRCVTNTLASERSMTITTFQASLSPITLYTQE